MVVQPPPETPFFKNLLCYTRSKPGSSGKQPKTNQDTIIVNQDLPTGIKLFGVCDGHGLNGHLVSAYIQCHLVSILGLSQQSENLNKLLHRRKPEENLVKLLAKSFEATNKSLLQSEIDT